MKNTLKKAILTILATILTLGCTKEYIEVNHTTTTITKYQEMKVVKNVITNSYGDTIAQDFYLISIAAPNDTIATIHVENGKDAREADFDFKRVDGGQNLYIYYENNGIEGYDEGKDQLKAMTFIPDGADGKDGNNGTDGKDGADGKDGKSAGFSMNIEPTDGGFTISYVVTIGGVVTQDESQSFTLPQGAPGISVYPAVIDLYDEEGNKIGFTLQMWRDTDSVEGISAGDELSVQKDVYFVGQSITQTTDESGTTVVFHYLKEGVWTDETIFIPAQSPSTWAKIWDFNLGNTYDMQKEGAEFKNMSSSDRALHGLYNHADSGCFISPTLSPLDDAYRVDFKYGATTYGKLYLYYMVKDEWVFSMSMGIKPFPHFDKYDPDTYATAGMWFSPSVGHIQKIKIIYKMTDIADNPGDVKTMIRVDDLAVHYDDAVRNN